LNEDKEDWVNKEEYKMNNGEVKKDEEVNKNAVNKDEKVNKEDEMNESKEEKVNHYMWPIVDVCACFIFGT
jgi:hypothetical protein